MLFAAHYHDEALDRPYDTDAAKAKAHGSFLFTAENDEQAPARCQAYLDGTPGGGSRRILFIREVKNSY